MEGEGKIDLPLKLPRIKFSKFYFSNVIAFTISLFETKNLLTKYFGKVVFQILVRLLAKKKKKNWSPF